MRLMGAVVDHAMEAPAVSTRLGGKLAPVSSSMRFSVSGRPSICVRLTPGSAATGKAFMGWPELTAIKSTAAATASTQASRLLVTRRSNASAASTARDRHSTAPEVSG